MVVQTAGQDAGDEGGGSQALEQHLAEGRKVLVNIDAQTIWNKADVVRAWADPRDHTSPNHNVEVSGN